LVCRDDSEHRRILRWLSGRIAHRDERSAKRRAGRPREGRQRLHVARAGAGSEKSTTGPIGTMRD